MIIEFKKINVFGLEIACDASERSVLEHGSILILMLIGFTAFDYIYNGLFRPLSTEKVDFEAYYNAALAFKNGMPLYDHMIRFFKEGIVDYRGPLPYVYPPCFSIFLSPLAYLSFRQAALCWNLINQGLFFMSVILLMKAIKRQYSWIEWLTMIFLCMNFTPLFIDYLIGQSNIIILYFMTLGLYMYRANKDIYAGIALAMASIVKIIPLLLLVYMLWKRQYKIFFSAAVTLFLVFIYSLLFFDVELYLWYIKFMTNQTLFAAFHDNHSLTGFFSRLLTHSIWAKGVLNSPFCARICILLSSGFFLLSFLYVTRKKIDRSGDRSLHEYALAIITMLLISKMTSTPYLVMLLLPLGILVHELFRYRPSNKWILLLGTVYGVLATWYPLSVGKFLDMDIYKIYLKGFAVNIFSIQFFALVVLWCYFVFAPTQIGSDESADEISKKDVQSNQNNDPVSPV